MSETLIMLAVGIAIGYAIRDALSRYRHTQARRRAGLT
jgi:hypothetical protein